MACARTGVLATWLVPMFKEHAASLAPVCSTPPYALGSKYAVLLVAVASLVYYGIQLTKNMTVRHDESTIHSVTGAEFFVKHPKFNFKLQEAFTVQFAFSVYSYLMLILAILGDDYGAQINYVVIDAVMWVVWLISSIVSMARGTAGTRNQTLVEGLHMLISALMWTFLVCNVNTHFGVCT